MMTESHLNYEYPIKKKWDVAGNLTDSLWWHAEKGTSSENIIFLMVPEPQLSVTTEKLLHGPIVKNALYMANTEMETVKELDEDFYRQHLEKFIFYFTVGDNWAPLNHYDDMLRRFPEGKIILCDQGMPHAFVI
ncbi:16601_t:CDS:2, partial [Acaulospora colombiana]